jgi:serine/threonine protein phosphatase PrpC
MEQTIFNAYKPKFNIQIGHESKKGSKEINQDDVFIINKPEIDCIIMGVADGHGPTGEIASLACKTATTEFTDANMEELVTDPVTFLEKCFAHVQDSVRRAIAKDAERGIDENPNVQINSHGVVLTRRSSFQSFSNIKGGSMLSIAIFKAGLMYIANVGDCDAIVCSETPILKPTMVKYEKDSANPTKTVTYSDETLSDVLLITCDHSPDNPEEYRRIREFRPSENDANSAELRCIYDKQGYSKHECEPIFQFAEDGSPVVRDDVTFYHKNVRKDRATYISTPFDADYQDALASTRSVGDFNLNQYGLSEKPEIQSIDLNKVFAENAECNTLCFVMGSDGVWDNWLYPHVQKFVMFPNCLEAIKQSETPNGGVFRVLKSFMQRNQTFTEKNFGKNNCDDSTCVIMYITPNV